MKYLQYKKYQLKLKFYKTLAIAIFAGAVILIYKAKQKGITSDQVARWIYAICGICIVLLVAIKDIIKTVKKKRYLNSPLSKIDKLSGEEFEKYLQAHFENMGYKTALTAASHDYGADLICKNKEETIVIQAKRYNGKIGNAAIQQVVAAKAFYKATKCMVITNSFFTSSAVELAKSNEVELWDRNNINEKLIKGHQ